MLAEQSIYYASMLTDLQQKWVREFRGSEVAPREQGLKGLQQKHSPKTDFQCLSRSEIGQQLFLKSSVGAYFS